MACEEFQQGLSAFIDGELTGAEHARLVAHLQTCRECGVLLRQFQDTSHLVRTLTTPPAPAFLTESAMRAVRAMPKHIVEPWTARAHRLLFEPFFAKAGIGAVAAAAVVVLAVFADGEGWMKHLTPQGGDYRLASAPAIAPATDNDFRDPENHGRREVRTLEARQRFAWEHGVWHHERRFGRDGWWWEVNGAWYWYEQGSDGPPDYVSEVRFADSSQQGPSDPQLLAPPKQ